MDTFSVFTLIILFIVLTVETIKPDVQARDQQQTKIDVKQFHNLIPRWRELG